MEDNIFENYTMLTIAILNLITSEARNDTEKQYKECLKRLKAILKEVERSKK